MRDITQYSPTFKESIVTKALTPNAPPLVELAKEFNIPYATLYYWIKMRKKYNAQQGNVGSLRPAEQSAETKLRAVLETMNKTEEERAEYCRKHGFYIHHLDAWKQQMTENLGGRGMDTKNSREQKAENAKLMQEIKQLKGELKRKDKALAEVSALLILKKKADLLWGVEEDD